MTIGNRSTQYSAHFFDAYIQLIRLIYSFVPLNPSSHLSEHQLQSKVKCLQCVAASAVRGPGEAFPCKSKRYYLVVNPISRVRI